MKKPIKCFVLISFFISLCCVTKVTGHAQTTRFTVTPELPQNQVSDVTYFDLLVNHETEQNLIVALHNTSSETLTIQASALNSYTAATGIIAYQAAETAKDFGGVSFTTLIKKPNQMIQLEPGETRQVVFPLSMNDKRFTGEIIGAFSFEEEQKEGQEAEETSLTSTYKIVQGVRLRQQLDALPDPELSLIKSEAVEKDGIASLKSRIENDQPVAFGKIAVKTVIREQDSDSVVGGFTAESFQFGPNSTMDLYSAFDEEIVEPGTYHIQIELSAPRGTWVFEDSVTVSRPEAETINRKTIVGSGSLHSNRWVYIVAVVILLLISSLLLLMYLRRKKSKETTEQE